MELKTVIEASLIQALKLKTNPRQVHKGKCLPPKTETYSHQGFHDC